MYALRQAIWTLISKRTVEKSQKKCNHCDYALSEAGNLRRHLKKHIGEKTNKCKQCDFRSSQASNLRARLKIHKCNYESSGAEVLRGHFKTHRGEKLNKCSECSYASSQTGHLRRHMKTQKNVTSVTMHPLGKTNLWYSANTIRFGNIIRIRIRIYSVKK